VQRGIYRELLDQVWLKGWIPANDLVALSRIARVSVSLFEKNWPKVRELFVPLPGMDGERLTSERLERERGEIDRRRAKQAEGGRHSAERRKQAPSNRQVASTNTAQHNTTQALVTQAVELPTPHNGPVRSAAEWKRLLETTEPRGGADVS
jgi:uncharacterized protein YdaU (DUF1376 family)